MFNVLRNLISNSPDAGGEGIDEGRSLPGPSGWEWVRLVRGLRADPLGALHELHRKHGDVVEFFHPVLLKQAYLISDPEDVGRVLHGEQEKYRKASTYRTLEPTLGKGLLTSEGELWKRQRRLIAPMFHGDSLRSFARVMLELTEEQLQEWSRRTGEDPLDLDAEMRTLTFRIIGRCLFSTDLGDHAGGVRQAVKVLRRDVRNKLTNPLSLPEFLPTPWNRRVRKARRTLEDVVQELIQTRRGQEDEFDDLLSMLMLARDEESGETMSDQQIRDEVMTFLLAGHETTASALSWSFYLLGQDQHRYDRLRNQTDPVPEDTSDRLDWVSEDDFVDHVLNESMRLYPPAWMIERSPREDVKFGNHSIPADSLLMLSPYLVHRHPDHWEHPGKFRPERFADRDGSSTDFRFFPFGGGARMCVGREFARMEGKIVLRRVVDRFRIQPVDRESVEPEAAVTLHPAEGLPVRVEPSS